MRKLEDYAHLVCSKQCLDRSNYGKNGNEPDLMWGKPKCRCCRTFNLWNHEGYGFLAPRSVIAAAFREYLVSAKPCITALQTSRRTTAVVLGTCSRKCFNRVISDFDLHPYIDRSPLSIPPHCMQCKLYMEGSGYIERGFGALIGTSKSNLDSLAYHYVKEYDEEIAKKAASDKEAEFQALRDKAEQDRIKNPQETTDMAITEKTDTKQPSAAMEKIKSVGKTAIAQTKEDAEFVLIHGSAQQLLEAMSDAASVLASDDPKVIEFLRSPVGRALLGVFISQATVLMPDVLVTEGSEELFTAVRRMAYLDAVHGPATALRKAAQKVIGDYSKALMDIRGKIDVKPVE